MKTADTLEAQVKAAGLTGDEFDRIVRLLGREPNALETALFGALWSEHCSYKSSRHLLGRLPTRGPGVLVGPGENAGVIDVGEGYAVAFKMESHNHPSFVEPFQGAATGVGGILRDIIALGARPIALADALRFGAPTHPRTRRLLDGVVRGIAAYGNAIGVPVVAGDTAFDAGYDRNILVNVFALGVVAKSRILRGRADLVGSPVFLVGARTGRDGLRGATMASAAFASDGASLRPNVQVGDPYVGKLLLEACLELAKNGALAGLQDLGAAGLASAASEMAARSGVGMRLDLARVPQRENAMSAEEILLSETQERMLLVAHAGSEEEVRRVAEKWDLDAEIVGEVTDSGLLDVIWNDTSAALVPLRALVDDAPSYERPAEKRTTPATARSVPDLPEMLADPSHASKRWIWQQFDHSVRVGTVVGPGRGDAAVVRIPNTDRAVGIAVGSSQELCVLDPRIGARHSVMSCARKLACVGAQPIGATDCLNLGDPTDPHVSWQLSEVITGIAEACRALGVPVVSGNVSLYNATDGVSIPPTPMIGLVGLCEDASATSTIGFRKSGDLIFVVGSQVPDFQPLSDLDDARELALQDCVRALVRGRLVVSAHVVASGLERALAESCLAGAIGARVDADPAAYRASHIVVSCDPSKAAALRAMAAHCHASVTEIGTVGGDVLSFGPRREWPLAVLRGPWESALPNLVGELPAGDDA